MLRSSTLAAVLALGLFGSPCGAAEGPSAGAVLLAQAEGIGPDAAASIVRGALGGKVLSVDSVVSDGRPLYRVKVLLSGGRVKTVLVDGATGRMLR